MATVITNIRQLVNVREESKLLRGKELSVLPSIENAYLVTENGLIAEYGNMNEIQNSKFEIRLMQLVNSFCHAGVIHIHIWYLQQAGKKSLLIK